MIFDIDETSGYRSLILRLPRSVVQAGSYQDEGGKRINTITIPFVINAQNHLSGTEIHL